MKPTRTLDFMPDPGSTDFIDLAKMTGLLVSSREIGAATDPSWKVNVPCWVLADMVIQGSREQLRGFIYFSGSVLILQNIYLLPSRLFLNLLMVLNKKAKASVPTARLAVNPAQKTPSIPNIFDPAHASGTYSISILIMENIAAG